MNGRDCLCGTYGLAEGLELFVGIGLTVGLREGKFVGLIVGIGLTVGLREGKFVGLNVLHK